MKIRVIAFISLSCLVFPLAARSFGDGFVLDEFCDTDGKYDSNTTATFFGDSRMQLAHSNLPFYGGFGGDLGFYLGTDSNWNIQNFGQSASTSDDLLASLRNCLPKAKFKIAKNVAFHQGGNDYMRGYIWLKFMPWKINDYSNNALNNIEKIISLFQRRNKNILLIGNYPGVSYSLIDGHTAKYAFDAFNPNIILGPSERESLQDKMGDDVEEIDARLRIRDTLKAAKVWGPRKGPLETDDPIPTIPGFPVQPLDDYVQNMRDELHKAFDKFLGRTEEMHGWNPYYYAWVFDISNDVGTVPSLGLVAQENAYAEIVQRRVAHGANLQYTRVWEFFVRYPNALAGEAWVANHELYGDIVHPNPAGYLVWGQLVGNKLRDMGWNIGPKGVEFVSGTSSDDVPLPGEVSDRPADLGPNIVDIIIICYSTGVCS